MRYFELTEARIDEYDQTKTIQALGDKIFQAAEQDGDTPEDLLNDQAATIKFILDQLEKMDPTKNKTYTLWLAREYSRQRGFMQDFKSKVDDTLPKYVELKKIKALPPGTEDLNKFSLSQIRTQIFHLPDADEVMAARKGEQAKAKGQYEEVYNGEDCRIIHVQDELAAKYYGRGTKWCTNGESSNFFDNYNGDGPIYVLLPKHPRYDGEKFQFHAEMDEYRDDADVQVNEVELLKRFPGMGQFLGNSRLFAAYNLYRKDPSKAAEAIQMYPLIIQHIEQTPELCKMAVDRSPWALYYIKDQTFELCLYTARREPGVLRGGIRDDGMVERVKQALEDLKS